MAVLSSKLIVSLIDQVTRPARSIAGQMGRMTDQLRRNQRDMARMRGSMVEGAAAGYALARGLAAPVKAAMAFEDAMADVNKVVDFDAFEKETTLEDLSASILEMSRYVPLAAEGIASIVAAAGQAGMKGDELLQFAEIAAKVGVAFDMTADEVGTSLAKIKTALGLSVSETELLADAINHLSNTSASEAPSLLDYMRRVGSIGKQYGFTAEQTVAIGSAMIAAGAQADVAATSFRNVGKALARGESATKRQRTAYKRLGLDARVVAKSLQKDAVGTLNSVLELVRQLPKELQASTVSDLFGDEARAIMPLIENTKLLKQSLGEVSDEFNYVGSAQKEFDVRANTSSNTLQLLQNRAKEVAIAIGNALLPAIMDVAWHLGPILTSISEWVKANPELTAGIVGLAAALVAVKVAAIASAFGFAFLKGGALTAGLGVARAASLIVAASKQVRMAMLGMSLLSSLGSGAMVSGIAPGLVAVGAALKGVAIAVAAAVATISAPIWLLIGGIAAVSLAIYNYWEPIREFVTGFASTIMEALDPLITAMTDFGKRLATAAGTWAKEKLVDIGELIGFDRAEVEAMINDAVTMVTGLADRIIAAVRGIPSAVGDWISDLFSMNDYSAEQEAEFRSAGERAGRAAVDAIKNAFSSLANGMQALGKQMMDALLQGIIDGAKAILSYVGNLGSQIKSKIMGSVSGAFDSVKGFFGGGSDTKVAGERAAGGPVKAGMTYMTGERGRELFTAPADGYVHNASDTDAIVKGKGGAAVPGGRSTTIQNLTMNIYEQTDAHSLLQQLEDKLADAERGLHADLEHASTG
ncbi:family phage tail tape measure protein [Roseibium sp. TrichSKD4]|uniref:phage tail tape measure protein n=1 Tax=Roseibium sp. TrichSKD4 TaxID=744980 RepID=UPI0001E56E09|nr:phage tail tape measure protein [Roseibium sp. TrichSKD4]EFO31540.1 family phage tail tape measure protein [Roseibium sp. TrichSKD4]